MSCSILAFDTSFVIRSAGFTLVSTFLVVNRPDSGSAPLFPDLILLGYHLDEELYLRARVPELHLAPCDSGFVKVSLAREGVVMIVSELLDLIGNLLAVL